MAKRSDAQKMKGKGGEEGVRMRWEDCAKRDLERVGGEWRTTAKRYKELETVDRECSERKVRREKKTKKR